MFPFCWNVIFQNCYVCWWLVLEFSFVCELVIIVKWSEKLSICVCVHCISLGFYLLCICDIVLKRCISGLPKSECPFIPKRIILQQAYSRRIRRNVIYNETDFQHDLVKRSPIRFPDELPSLSQKAVNEPKIECEDRRQLGTQILKEKGEYADSMLSRFVGNFIMIFSNQTTAQEVSNFSCAYESWHS